MGSPSASLRLCSITVTVLYHKFHFRNSIEKFEDSQSFKFPEDEDTSI